MPETHSTAENIGNGKLHERTEKTKNEATKASNQFIEEKQNKFTRAIGTVLRTAATEFLTWFGAPLVPIGIIGAGAIMTFKGMASPFLSSYNPAEAAAFKGILNIGAGAGIGAAAVGGLATAAGIKIGYEGAKHSQDTKTLFKAGKFVEFAGIAAGMFGIPVYPITKAFSVAATFFSQLKRPGSF